MNSTSITRRDSLARSLADVGAFSQVVLSRPLRAYQLDVARAILRSVEDRAGRTITVLFPRQSGKNEMSAQLEAFLLTRHQLLGGSPVKCAPTFRPQILNSIARLTGLLDNPLTGMRARTANGYEVVLGRARAQFFSAAPGASVVGGTASLLLEGDEVQDLDPTKWDKDFLPMAAVGNATRVLWGTPWADDDLLAVSIAEAKAAEARDGIRRHFEIGWQSIAAENPLYGRHVEAEMARLGPTHPIVRTQYLLQRLVRAGRLLDTGQLATLMGEHPPEPAPVSGARYVAAVDVAGADEEDPEGVLLRVNPKRDSTVLSIARVEPVKAAVPSGAHTVVEPRLRLVAIYAWLGTPTRQLYPTVLQLVRGLWGAGSVVVDATGVGGGLAAYLGAALGPRVVQPFVYTEASKSDLAYSLLGAVNDVRLSVYAESSEDLANDARRELLGQCAAEYGIRAHQRMTFHVPESRGHDDHLNMLALLTKAATVEAARAASGSTGRRPTPSGQSDFRDQRPSRR